MNELKPVYEDDSIVIFDKPQGIATAPGENPDFCTRVFAAYPFLKTVAGYRPEEGGLLNRLDNETGGLLLFAKSNESFKYYSKQMNEGKIEKTYTAKVFGIPAGDSGTIDIPIAHHYSDAGRMVCVVRDVKYRGKPRNAVTLWKKMKTTDGNSILEVKIFKGARHQIRVHLAHEGHPIVGDKLYNKNRSSTIEDHCLYANGIKFVSFFSKNIILSVNVPFNND